MQVRSNHCICTERYFSCFSRCSLAMDMNSCLRPSCYLTIPHLHDNRPKSFLPLPAVYIAVDDLRPNSSWITRPFMQHCRKGCGRKKKQGKIAVSQKWKHNPYPIAGGRWFSYTVMVHPHLHCYGICSNEREIIWWSYASAYAGSKQGWVGRRTDILGSNPCHFICDTQDAADPLSSSFRSFGTFWKSWAFFPRRLGSWNDRKIPRNLVAYTQRK